MFSRNFNFFFTTLDYIGYISVNIYFYLVMNNLLIYNSNQTLIIDFYYLFMISVV